MAREVRRGGRILILDEPTACLSAEAAHQIRELARTLRDEGVAVVYIPHYIDEVLAVADLGKLGALDAGWIAQDAGGKNVRVGVIAGAPGAASDLMVGGFTKALPSTAKVVANQPGMFNPVKAQDMAENMIQAHPGLQYAFVASEDMALAARKAFDAAGKKDVKIVIANGTDEDLAAVKDGRLSATVANHVDRADRGQERRRTPGQEEG
ncbi:substrate-binding domain-containing protein [Streptomyces sp. NPDC001100]